MRLHDSVVNRIPCQFGRTVKPQLLHDSGLMEIYRLNGDIQDSRDFLVGFAFRDQFQNFFLPGSELLFKKLTWVFSRIV